MAIEPAVVHAKEGEPFTMTETEHLLWKVTAKDTGGRFDAAEVTALPFVSGPPQHIHDNSDEIFYVLEGTVRVLLGDQLHDAEEGTLVFIPRGTSHTWINGGAVPARFLTMFIPGGMQGFFESTAPLVQQVPPDLDALAAAAAQFDTRLSGPPLPPLPRS
ncbi:cupin domain-containing protein [Nocardia sp. NPDC059764]|uniref:cupin domain-containing protein n=1 Tax=Nocardia sp. NPDC059764 TaxID=3346939 RepID=UPI003663A062